MLLRRLALPLLCLLSAPALALPPPAHVPAPLQTWVPWVLHLHRDLSCTVLGDARACAWPGHLSVHIADDGGTFEQDVWLDKPARAPLPGDKPAWPQEVLLDDQPARVEATPEGMPVVPVPAGHHVLKGRFAWASAPEVLAVPDEIGVVDLTLRGQPVDSVRRDAEGRLFLQKAGTKEATEVDTLTVTVARRLEDGVPLRETTRLTLRIAGQARDIALPPVLLAGGRAVLVRSELPLQLGEGGAVRIHGQPGQHVIDLVAVHAQPEAALQVPKRPSEAFDAQETWVWVPQETLRSVELSGLQAIDPQRTQLAADWKDGRTYTAQGGQTLTLTQTRRGEQEPAPNRIELARELWLDEDGQGLTARDKLTGELHQGWRLDVAPGMQLGRAGALAGSAAHLITADPKTGKAGVELREGKLGLEADSRIAKADGELGIVGWNHDVQRLTATLHLPPGWELLGASGVDVLPQTWVGSWTLFDFFFVLMLALGTGKLLGLRWGAVALLGLALCHGKLDAPEWLWLNALAALALLRVLPPHWFRKLVQVYHALAVLLLVVALVPFAREELRVALHPQVAFGGHSPLSPAVEARSYGLLDAGLAKADAPAPTAAPAAPAAPAAGDGAADMDMREEGAKQEGKANLAREKAAESMVLQSLGASTRAYAQRQLQQIDPNAVVQTGPGVPQWQWTTLPLGWSGPVQKDHKVTLWLLSPRMQLLLALLRVALVVALGLRLLDWTRLRALKAQIAARTLPLLLLVLLPKQAQAQQLFPPAEVLATLEQRLLEAQGCEGPCVSVSRLGLKVSGQEVLLTAEVHAQRDAGWALPGPNDPLQIREVRLDDLPTWQLRRQPGGLVAVRVPAGRHVVTVQATLVRRTVLTLQFDPNAVPHQVQFDSADWAVDGLDPNGVPDASLQLTRRALPATGLPHAPTPGDTADADTSPELPPWFSVERHLELGLPWRVRTVVRREGTLRPQLVKVPLLAGEAVITDGIRIENGAGNVRHALVNFARDDGEASFESELPIAPTLSLRAPAGEPWTETWQLSCSSIWRCSFKGLPPVHTRDPQDAALRPLWQPWPGEALEIAVVRPEGAPGQAVTLDSVDYRVTPGQRLLQAVLTLQVRTSQGGWRTLTLPEGADVQSVTLAGQPRTIRPQGRMLKLPLEPGAQTLEVRWQQPWQRSAHETAPPVDLGGPAANVQVTVELGPDRWLLWTHGPAWGPAVLFWNHLLWLLAFALLLGRLRGPPLQTRDWLLLSLGMAQLPAPLALLVVGWFLALAWRRARGLRQPPMNAGLFDALQLGLALLTLLALGTLYGAIHQNLLLDVDMQVSGAGSTAQALRWYVAKTQGALPEAGVWSLPLWVWRVAMLAWALWLVRALLRWLPWAWRSVAMGGLWQRLARRIPPPPAARAPMPPPPPPPPPPPASSK